MSGSIGHTMYAHLAGKGAVEKKLPVAPIIGHHFASYLAGSYLGGDIQTLPEPNRRYPKTRNPRLTKRYALKKASPRHPGGKCAARYRHRSRNADELDALRRTADNCGWVGRAVDATTNICPVTDRP